MTDKKNTKKAPNLRFKGFTDDWEERKLGKIVEFYSGLTYSPDNIIPKGGTFVLRSSNVKNGELINADNVYVDSSFVNSSNVQIGDIVVVVRNGSRNLIGKHAQVKKYMENTVIGAFMTGIRAKEPNYINALLNTQQFKIEINKNLGATINQITTGAFKKMQFSITPNIEEQHEIGSFFYKLDNCITLHQRKLDQLNQLKAALLQQMFPGKSETVPKLRFAGFEGDWEERKYNDVCKITMGQSPNGANYTQNPRDHILVQGNADMKNGEVVPRIWTTQVTKVANVNDIILGVRAPVGVVGITKYDVVIGRGVAGIKGSIFIYYDLVQKLRNNYWSKYSTGSTFDSINSEDIKNASIYFPYLTEQNHIGTFFKSLDSTIVLHQRKLEQLQNMKQVLLENMFI